MTCLVYLTNSHISSIATNFQTYELQSCVFLVNANNFLTLHSSECDWRIELKYIAWIKVQKTDEKFSIDIFTIRMWHVMKYASKSWIVFEDLTEEDCVLTTREPMWLHSRLWTKFDEYWTELHQWKSLCETFKTQQFLLKFHTHMESRFLIYFKTLQKELVLNSVYVIANLNLFFQTQQTLIEQEQDLNENINTMFRMTILSSRISLFQRHWRISAMWNFHKILTIRQHMVKDVMWLTNRQLMNVVFGSATKATLNDTTSWQKMNAMNFHKSKLMQVVTIGVT